MRHTYKAYLVSHAQEHDSKGVVWAQSAHKAKVVWCTKFEVPADKVVAHRLSCFDGAMLNDGGIPNINEVYWTFELSLNDKAVEA